MVFFFAASNSSVFAFSFGPNDGLTGAPGEGNCTQCHSGNSLNASGGTLVLGVPGTYLPGEMYDIVVDLSRSGQSRWGFEMTALNGNGARAGTFIPANNGNTQVTAANSKQYIKQTTQGSASGTRDKNQWAFKWTAPTNDVGPITFYAAGNAANGDFGTSGDYIYTQSNTSEVPVYGVTLAGVGSLKTETTDANAAVTYTLKVTNTSNTNDTINLSTSGDASATLSPTTVPLDAGAARNVTLTVSGNALTTAGDYEVKVKATSQGDSTKTAEVTTTTTVPPVYGVTLAGVGDLTTETTDASGGMKYVLQVTNTGNTNDTISLAVSGIAKTTLNKTSVSLAAGASENFVLAIPGSSLATAGDYAAKVTATSQGDNAKTAEITTTTTILPVYGVTLTGIGDLTTETTDAGGGMKYILRVTNTGNTSDKVSLAVSGDAKATLNKTSVSLAARASENVILAITGPSLATAGDYSVKVTATSQGDNAKTAEITTTTTILPVYGVTLAGVGDLMTETSDASEGISYMLTVTNTGNTDDMIDLTTSGDAAATLSHDSVSLAAGASTEVTLTVSDALLTTAGDYEVKVTATSQGDNTKTAAVSTTTTILPVYGVTLAGVGELTTETSDASEGVSYMLTVTNTGNTDDVIDLSTSGDVAGTLSDTSISLASGASANVTLTVSGEVLVTAGTYEVKVTVTSQEDTKKTAEASTKTTILPVYGVTLTGVGELTTETADASEGVSYMLTVTNTGNTDDVIDLTSSNDAAILSQASVSLAGGASTEVTITLSGDALATAGDYEVNVTATSQGDNTMSSEVPTNTTILPVYGVTLTGVGELTTETTDASKGVSYMLTVTNTGNTDDVIDLTSSDDAAILSQASVSLAAGASTEVTITLSGDALATAGNYEVNVTATSQGDKTMSSEVSTNTTILPVYGVTLAGVGNLTTETSDASEGISYTLKITNISNTDDVIDLTTSGDATTLSQTVVPLAAGASAEIILTISGDDLAIAGQYEVKVTATSQVDKTKTAVISTKTTILPVYGVTLTGVGDLMTETSDASEGVSYKFTVTNTGNTDDVIDLTSSDDAATLSQTSVSLAGGASVEVTITISGDALATTGNYEVSVTATSQGDNTMSSEVPTNTTILPVYGVTLTGVGDLMTETSDASEGVSYKFTVMNTGNTDDVIDLTSSNDAATLSQTSVSLAAGASAEVTITISGDTLATAGDYEIKVTATSQGDEEKTDEVTTNTKILPVYGVTLAGVDELTTKTSDASEGVSYMLTVTNTGNTDDMIDLVTSGDAAATLSQDSVSLAAGASTEVTLIVSDAVLTTAGDYEVKVTATSQGDNTKTAAVSTTTTILPVYGVTLAGVGNLTTETSDASEGISYTLKITNISNTDDVIDLTTSGDATTLSQTVVPLAAGASAEIILTISGDDLAIAGQYEVKVTATSQVDKTKTAVISTKTTILPVYGVTLTGVGDLMTETSDASEGVSYKFTVMNTGNTDDVIDLTSSNDAATLSQTSVSLAAGASAEVTITISGDALATAGDYEIKVTATSQGDEEKTDEVTTNTKILPVYGVTLAGVDELTTKTSDASEGVSYMLTVTNTGNTDDVIDLTSSDDAATLSQTSVSLAGGASVEVTITISGDALATAGNYEVKVTATSQGDNTMSSEVPTNTTILPVYGVTLAGVGELTSETSDASEGISYMLTVTNTGNTDDMIDLVASGDAAATLSQDSVSLATGASTEVTLTVSDALLTTAGDYEVKVTATSQGDNTKTAAVSTTTTILPVYGVTLAGVGDLMTETSDASEGVSYMLTVTNTGNTDDVIDLTSSDDAAILSQTPVSLAAGASTEVTITISGDALATAGNYEVNVTATSQGDKTMSSEVSTNTTILPVYGVTLAGVGGELTGTTMDMLAGVSYTLTVTNTGNTEDTVVLGSSAEFGIEGSVLGSFSQSDDQEPTTSQLEIMLAAGASAEVIFTAAGDFFTKPGEYEIKVTATSQSDSTKTAELTTNTTIEPVPWDLNADGTVNILDLVAVANQFGESGEGLSGDVNMDGEVNILDLVQVASYFGKTQAEIVQAQQ